MHILVLSAYDAESHKRWHQGLVAHLPEINFTVLTLPPRYFNWRVRGNAMTWALNHRAELLAHPWDAILATSMVDLATLKGLMPTLAHVPSVLYFHENQFAYPKTHSKQSPAHNSIEPQMVSLYSAIAADKLVFNSEYNRRTFLAGAAKLLQKLPDHVPKGIVESFNCKAQVLPVPLESSCFELANKRANVRPTEKPLTVIWNHRWEYDKGPEGLLEIIKQCTKTKPNGAMRWHIVGQQFRNSPCVFEEIKALLATKGWLGAWGFQPFMEYQALLVGSDIVLSTAQHDFQGLAVMDAVAAGARPLLPDDLAYPEFFSADYLYSPGSCEPLLQDDLTRVSTCATSLLPRWQALRHEYHKVLTSWP